MALASLGLVALPYAAGGGLHAAAAVLLVLTVLAVRSPESLWVAGLLVGHAIHWTATTPAPTRLGDWLALLVGAWLALLVHVCASAAWPCCPAGSTCSRGTPRRLRGPEVRAAARAEPGLGVRRSACGDA